MILKTIFRFYGNLPFNTELLIDVLRTDKYQERLDDFGGDIIPFLIKQGEGVFGYSFDGYWRDIGTIRSFYETNLELTEEHPGFNFYDPDKPIFTHPRFLPCSSMIGCTLKNVLIAEGCLISNATIEHSVIGLRSQNQRRDGNSGFDPHGCRLLRHLAQRRPDWNWQKLRDLQCDYRQKLQHW